MGRRPGLIYLQECRAPRLTAVTQAFGYAVFTQEGDTCDSRVAVAVRSDRIKNYEVKINRMERWIVELTISRGDKRIVIRNMYLPPSGSRLWKDRFSEYIARGIEYEANIVLCGDLNIRRRAEGVMKKWGVEPGDVPKDIRIAKTYSRRDEKALDVWPHGWTTASPDQTDDWVTCAEPRNKHSFPDRLHLDG